jgi:enamine deaminase RidA (YjgF/YER057c/UK114 family)
MVHHLSRPTATRLAAVLILSAVSVGVGILAPPTMRAALAQQGSAGPIAQQLVTAAQNIDAALAAMDAGDLATARLQYGAYDDAWDALEDRIRDPHPDVYDAIERAMDQVDDTLLKVDNPSPARAAEALQALRQTIDAQAPQLG